MNLLDALHRRLGRSPLAVGAALKLRNQIAAVIRYSRASGIHAAENGEGWLVAALAPSCRTFVDVGANVGEWTALFLAASGGLAKGLLFEPSPGAGLGRSALVLVLEVVVVPDERLQLLAERPVVGDDVPRHRSAST